MMMVVTTAWLVGGCDTGECESDRDCDDGVYCNGAESCVSGRCLASNWVDCSDHIDCTTDACDESRDTCVHTAVDRDGDGHFGTACSGDDCDDDDPTAYTGAIEACDGVDNDCDGVVNEDRDGDGHFDSSLCDDGDDCDDDDPLVYPGAPEVCDGIDNNCSGDIDDEEDTDGDGSIDITCSSGDDCDDEDPTVRPGAAEICNGNDDDCDGAPDEDFDCVEDEWSVCLTVCETVGRFQCSDECTVPPLPSSCEPPDEVCNGRDDDCDGTVDDDLPCISGELTECTTTCGSTGTGTCTDECLAPPPEQCSEPPESCNGVDDNCNGWSDEGFTCAAGSSSACTTICGSTGTGTCAPSCTPAPPEACEPPDEVCNDFRDNDCDGDIDCTDEDCIMDMYCGG
jgi:hypothetical protein